MEVKSTKEGAGVWQTQVNVKHHTSVDKWSSNANEYKAVFSGSPFLCFLRFTFIFVFSQVHLPIPDLSFVTARIDNEGTEVLFQHQ